MVDTQAQLDALNALTAKMSGEKTDKQRRARQQADEKLRERMLTELGELQAETQRLKLRAGTKHRYTGHRRKSKLDRAAAEILELHGLGATVTEIQRYLTKRRIHVHWSTVSRWLKQRTQWSTGNAEITENP